MKFVLIFLSFIVLSSCKTTEPLKLTQSGKAEGTFKNTNIDDVSYLVISELCINEGMLVVEQSKNLIHCAGQMGIFEGALWQSFLTGSYGTTPESNVLFSMYVKGDDVNVVVQQYVTSQNFFGKTERAELDTQENINLQQQALYDIGAL